MSKSPRDLRDEFANRVRREYVWRFPNSAAQYKVGDSLFPNSIAQFGRMTQPFPLYFDGGHGSRLHDVDGNSMIDFWAGHFCMFFGHHALPITKQLEKSVNESCFLQLGVNTSLEAEVATEILSLTGDDRILFSTSGALATMHAIMIASAATQRQKILKIAGGWHGVQPWTMSAVRYPPNTDFTSKPECDGIPEWFAENVIAIPFNNVQAAEDAFDRHGDEIAGCVLELVLGNAGMVMATPEFVQCIRRLCTKYGAAMIIDELVTGFRVRPGGMQTLFNIRGDISTYGKALSGGLPFACIVGSSRFMEAVRNDSSTRVIADVGTFTAHPGTLNAVKTTVKMIRDGGQKMYNDIIDKSKFLKDSIEQSFSRHSVNVDITGNSTIPLLESFPIATVRFIKDHDRFSSNTDALVHWDVDSNDIEFRNEIIRLYLCLKGIFPWQGLGVITAAHSDEDVASAISVYEALAEELEGLFPMTQRSR